MGKRLMLVAFCFLTVTIAAGFTLASSEAEARPLECEIAVAWAESNHGILPRDYEDFSTYTLVWRKAIYSQLSSEARVALWEDHLGEVMTGPALSVEQRDFIAEVRSNVEHYLLTGPSGESSELSELAKEVLGFDIAKWAFADLGAPSAESETLRSEACSCSTRSDYCSGNYECGDDEDGCDVIRDECGFLWMSDCDGECLTVQAP